MILSVARDGEHMMTPIEVLTAIEKHLERCLQRKSGWGKNEVMVAFHRASAMAMAELLGRTSDE